MATNRRIWVPAALFAAGLALITDAVVLGALRPPYAIVTAATAVLALGIVTIAIGFATMQPASRGSIAGAPVPPVVEEIESTGIAPEPRILVIGSMPIFLDAWRAGESRRRLAGWIVVGVALLAVFLAILVL